MDRFISLYGRHLSNDEERSRYDLLRDAVALLPEDERDNILSLIDVGKGVEAAHQMQGVLGGRAIPEEAHTLIDRAMA